LADVIGDVVFGSFNAVAHAVVGGAEDAVCGGAFAGELGGWEGESGGGEEEEGEEGLCEGRHYEYAERFVLKKVGWRRKGLKGRSDADVLA
jgi:hypothetical protein